MINFRTYFTEALSLKTAREYTKASKGKYKELLDDIFNGEHRIYIPLDIQRSDLKTTPLIKKIKSYIETDKKIPIEEFDYIGGYIKSKKQTMKIGRLIKDNIKLAKAFEQDPLRTSKDLLIVISRHPYDIAGMSTDRGWASCMTLPDKLPGRKKSPKGEFSAFVKRDIEAGTLIAYLISNKDRNINNPLSRVLLNPYKSDDGSITYNAGKIYGIPNKYFKKRVEKWIDENFDKSKFYYKDKSLYNDDAVDMIIPKNYTGSIETTDAIKWYLNGKLHREDGPAIEYADGTKEWYLNGMRHREDGPAVEWFYGTKAWCFNGKLHREDGPAIEYADGIKEWYLNGKLYREDGPVIEYPDDIKERHLSGERYIEDTKAGPVIRNRH
jgi:hypothetical protein